MRLSAEILTNPGQQTLFAVEVRIEKSERMPMYKPWWGLWLGWWLYKPKHWRNWLWTWVVVRDGEWFTFEVRLLGFEINWQRKRVKEPS